MNGTVHVWLADAAVPSPVVGTLLELLDEAELARHASIRHSIDRRRFVVAHAVTRLIVASFLDGVPPEEIHWPADLRTPQPPPTEATPAPSSTRPSSNAETLANAPAPSSARPSGRAETLANASASTSARPSGREQTLANASPVRGGTGPAELRWVFNPNGKPSLDGPGPHVNLSHSGDLLMLALCPHRPVGVDLQRIMSGLDVTAMARRFYPPAEVPMVAGPAGHERFAELWARKEALVKAAGGRLTRGLALPTAGPAPCVVDHDGPYRIADLAAPDGFRAAVALAGAAPFTVEQYRY